MAIKIQKLVDSVLEIAALPKTTVCAESTLQVFFLLPKGNQHFHSAQTQMLFQWASQCYNATHLKGAQYFSNKLQQEVWQARSCHSISPWSLTCGRYAHVAARHCLNSVWSTANGLNRRRAAANQRSFSQERLWRASPVTSVACQVAAWDLRHAVLCPGHSC